MTVGLVQMNSGENPEENRRKAHAFIDEAVSKQVQFLCFPEVYNFRKTGGRSRLLSESVCSESIQQLASRAKQEKMWILAGSICETIPSSKKVFNTSVLLNSRGDIHALYRKMNLFRVNTGLVRVDESKHYESGKEPVLTDVMGIKTGLSICYDLRFPELYRQYAKNGAQILCVPSSFTKKTGEAHWEVLLRARAIENQCFVLAPNQFGVGAGGVETYGNSLIIDPWGRVLGRGSGDTEGVITADLSFEELNRVRQVLPSSFLTLKSCS